MSAAPAAATVTRRQQVLLTAALGLSNVGTAATWVALPWFVLQTTGSATQMGLVAAAELAPAALLGAPAGAFAQRIGAARAVVLCDLLRVPLMAAIVAMHVAGLLTLPVLLTLVAATGVFLPVYYAAVREVLADLAGGDAAEMSRISAGISMAGNLGRLAGPGIAGLVIAATSPMAVIAGDAATFAVSAALLAAALPAWKARRTPAGDDPDAADAVPARTALLEAAKDRPAVAIALALLAIETSVQLLVVALPALVDARYDADPRALGTLAAASSAGMLLGAVRSWRAGAKKVDQGRAAATAALAPATVLWLLLAPVPWPAAAAVLVASSAGVAGALVPLGSLLTVRIPEGRRTAVMSAVASATVAAAPAALTGAGVLVDRVGVTPLLATMAAMFAGAALLTGAAARTARPAVTDLTATRPDDER